MTTAWTRWDTTQFATFIFKWFRGVGCGSAARKKQIYGFAFVVFLFFILKGRNILISDTHMLFRAICKNGNGSY